MICGKDEENTGCRCGCTRLYKSHDTVMNNSACNECMGCV